MVTSFVEARNSFDAEKLAAMTPASYKELFKNDFAEVKNQQEFLDRLDWAKEMGSTTKINEVISENDSIVVVLEQSTNYIDVKSLINAPTMFCMEILSVFVKSTILIFHGNLRKKLEKH